MREVALHTMDYIDVVATFTTCVACHRSEEDTETH